MDLAFRILGPLEVETGSRVIALGRRERALLGVLLLSAGEVVSVERLIDGVWGEARPSSVKHMVHEYVSRLRAALGDPSRIETRVPGYVARCSEEELDALLFARLVVAARAAARADDHSAAMPLYEHALALWRGDASLAGVELEGVARLDAARLDQERRLVGEERVDSALALGGHRQVIPELERTVREAPLLERPRAQLMLALYRSGRQIEALKRYREGRELAVDHAGVDPGRELRNLERAILVQDPALDLATAVSLEHATTRRPQGAVATPSGAPPAESAARGTTRRLVSVIVVDVDDELEDDFGIEEEVDTERRHGARIHLLDALRTALEAHGGVVQRLPGGVAAVFGLERAHEDDAARAVRSAVAAATIADAASEARVVAQRARIGIASGEILADSDWYLTAGAVSDARRLARNAPDGEILLDATTVELASEFAEYEPAVLQGVYRLASNPDPQPRGRAPGVTPFVNRECDRAALMRSFEQAVENRRARLVLVLGPPGIGKSRLVREFLGDIHDRASIAAGRSLSYGEGTSTFPVEAVVRCLVGDPIRSGLASCLDGVEHGSQIADRVAAAIGAGGGGSEEEIQWAFRRLLETVATDLPLVVALEDVHWAEPWLLDLLEYIAAFATRPIMLVACARDSLLQSRPGWVGPGAPGDVVALEPLSHAQTRQLIENLLGDRDAPEDASARMTERSEGNPLFAEQIVAFEIEHEFAPSRTVPTTLRSLIQERLDDLPPGQRDLLARAAVEGVVFHRGALTALAEGGARGDRAAAMALVRAGFLSPADSEVRGEDAFRFGHVLVRDVAYEALPKDQRKQLHLRFADWLQATAPDHAICGHHLRAAWLYARELGADDEGQRELGSKAAAHLFEAAEAALARSAFPAAVELFRQVAELLPPSASARRKALVEMGSTLLMTGQIDGARVALESARLGVGMSGALVDQAHADILELQLELQVGPDSALARIPGSTRAAARIFRALGDDLGMCRAYHTRALAHWYACRCQAAADDWERAASHARRAGRESVVPENLLAWVASAMWLGSAPVATAVERCERLLEEMRSSPLKQAEVRRKLGILHALDADFDRAHASFDESDRMFDAMGNTVHSAARDVEALAAMLEGKPREAERLLRESIERLECLDDRFHLPIIVATLAAAVLAQGRVAEAVELTGRAEQLAAHDDVALQASWRSTRARALARSGDSGEGERLALEAVALLAGSDWLIGRADAAEALAVAHLAAGDHNGALLAMSEALSLYTQKGARPLAEAARRSVDELRGGGSAARGGSHP